MGPAFAGMVNSKYRGHIWLIIRIKTVRITGLSRGKPRFSPHAAIKTRCYCWLFLAVFSLFRFIR
jgi:hypothetical protein